MPVINIILMNVLNLFALFSETQHVSTGVHAHAHSMLMEQEQSQQALIFGSGLIYTD